MYLLGMNGSRSDFMIEDMIAKSKNQSQLYYMTYPKNL